MKEESENLKYVKKTFKKVLIGFIGRYIGKILLMFCRISVRALVLAYPLKWILNDIFLKFEFKNSISFITAAEIIVVCSFLIRPKVTEPEKNDNYEEDQE